MDVRNQIIFGYRKCGLAGTDRGGRLILPPKQAFSFLKECYKSDLAVFGIEGFRIEKKSSIPYADATANFSEFLKVDWESYKKITFQSTKKFLTFFSPKPEIGFVFIMISKKEHRKGISLNGNKKVTSPAVFYAGFTVGDDCSAEKGL